MGRARRLILLSTAGATIMALVPGAPALAQEPDSGEDLAQVIVTGTRVANRGQGVRHEIEALSSQIDAVNFGALTRQEQADLRRLLTKLHGSQDLQESSEEHPQ